MKDLGTANGWYGLTHYPQGWDGPKVKDPDHIPPEYVRCQHELKHGVNTTRLGNCWHRYTCPVCNITWDVDSSD
jgi:hypothetical protein